jgi:hypothetical protein
LLAVQVVDALPLPSVVTVALASAQVAPDPGAENVTDTPLAGVPLEVTVATSGLANAVLTVVLCPDPLFTVIAVVGVFVT